MLQAHRLTFLSEHSVCGIWGCGAPTEALVAYHGFWFVLIVPAAVLGGRRLPVQRLRQVGLALAVLGVVGIAGVMAWAAVDWLREASGFQRQYTVQRCLFVFANLSDIPLLQVTVGGVACYSIAVVRGCKRQRAATTEVNHREQETRAKVVPS